MFYFVKKMFRMVKRGEKEHDVEWYEYDLIESNPVKNYCPRCGLELENTMSYNCNQSQCPTFVRTRLE